MMLLFLSAVYLITRIVNLKIMPIFTDEAIYSYWAQVALHDSANRFISLEDGKQPLFIWLAAIVQNFVSDPLLATRLVSIFSGLVSVIALYLLAKTLFNKNVALLSSFLYIVLPFTLLYDRMALFDSLLTTLGILSVLFSIKLAMKPAIKYGLLVGIFIGLAMITKSSGAFFLYLLPASLALFNFKQDNYRKNLSIWILSATLAFFCAQIIYNSLRLSALFYIISRKNMEFIRPFSEVVTDPFELLFNNSTSIMTWLIQYTSIPFFIIFLTAVIVGTTRLNKKVLYLSSLIFMPFLAEIIFNKVLYPRFLLFYFPYILVITSWGVYKVFTLLSKSLQKVAVIIICLILIQPIISSWYLLTEPTKAAIAQSDSGQYLNDWPAGNGVFQTVEILREDLKNDKIYVGTEGTFGLLPYALQIYFYEKHNIRIEGFWPVDINNLPQQAIDNAKVQKSYFLFNENQKEITNPNLKFIQKFQKGVGNSYMRLYQIVPK